MIKGIKMVRIIKWPDVIYSKAPIICTGFMASLAVHSYVQPNWHTYWYV